MRGKPYILLNGKIINITEIIRRETLQRFGGKTKA
jgi:hypothetical protein